MTTKFSFEVPVAHLEDFEDLQDFHFALSFLYRENVKYQIFMDRQVREGLKTVWLDNSYNEKMKADSINSLAKWANELRAHKVISPDSPKWNTQQIMTAYLNIAKLVASFRLIVVVESQTMMSQMALALGVKHFAISYWIRIKQTIDQYTWAQNCHFLGMLNLDEIKILQPPSCDTSMPIKIALKGWTLRQWHERGSPHIHTKDILNKFFDMKMTKKQIDLARQNIITLKEETK